MHSAAVAACRLFGSLAGPLRRRAPVVALICAGLICAPPVAVGSAAALRHDAKHAKIHRGPRRHVKRVVSAASRVTHGGAVQACPNANTPATSATVAEMDAAVVCLINDQRLERGLSALTVSSRLNRSAQGWTRVMVATGNFTHGPGTSFANRISATGYDWQVAGENIATGFPTPSSVVTAWMASTGHCQNILNPSFRNVGTGMIPAAVGGWAGGSATWTQDFGLRMGQSPPSDNRHPMDGCPY